MPVYVLPSYVTETPCGIFAIMGIEFPSQANIEFKRPPLFKPITKDASVIGYIGCPFLVNCTVFDIFIIFNYLIVL